MSEDPPPPPDPAAVAARREEKLRRRREKNLDSRPLVPWERYRALSDTVDHYVEVLDHADRKTRFALVILGLLNAINLLLVAGSNTIGISTTSLGSGLALYAAAYALLSLFFFSQAISALRPRSARLFRRQGDADGTAPPRLRSMAHVAQQDPDALYELWNQAQIGHVSREVAYTAQALAAINMDKYRALDRLFRGLTALTVLTAALLVVLAFVVISR